MSRYSREWWIHMITCQGFSYLDDYITFVTYLKAFDNFLLMDPNYWLHKYEEELW